MTQLSQRPTFATRACGHRVPKGRPSCPYCWPPRMPTAPLADALRERALRLGSMNAVSIEVATRLGMEFDSVDRRIRKIVSGSLATIEFDTADRYAIAIGQMPTSLWGKRWDDATPVEEPYGDENF